MKDENAVAEIRASHFGLVRTSSVHVLLLGDVAHREFQAAVRRLRSQAVLTIAADVAAAAAALERAAEPPDLVVIAQVRPGEFDEREIDRLRRHAPYAPFVALLGSLCEGESRSGSPWPGVVRVYWRHWPLRMDVELAALRSGRISAWSLPATASDEERLLRSVSQSSDKRLGLAAIAASRYESADWLADACRAQGWATLRTSPGRPVLATGVDLVLWDAGLASRADLSDLDRLKAAYPCAATVVLADFPRIGDDERLRSAGAAELLSKPVLLADLWRACLGRTGGD